MASFRVIACQATPETSFEYEREALDPIGAEIVPVEAKSEAEFIAAAQGADALLQRGLKVTAAIIKALPGLKVITTGGIGVDSIDVDAATEAGVVVTNVHDVFIDEVANHAMMFLLACAKKLVPLHQICVEGRWGQHRGVMRPMPKVTNNVLGLVAFGNIPRAVARRAKAFDMQVIAYDPMVPAEVFAEHGVRQATLEEVFAESDFVSCHVPLSKHTHHLIREEHFRLMKPTAYFINTGRGPVVDEAALIRALQEGWIAGAGLDVLEQEPPDPNNPILKLPNVVLTPHSASASDPSSIERRRRAGENIARVLTGRLPRSVVNREVLSKVRLEA